MKSQQDPIPPTGHSGRIRTRKKKRWEDRIFHFILRSRNSIGHTGERSGTTGRIYVGQKIILTRPVNGRIIIQKDRHAIRRLAFYVLLLFLVVTVILLRNSRLQPVTLALTLLITLPLSATAIALFVRARHKSPHWYIDLDQRLLVAYNGRIHLSRIRFFHLTKLIDPNEIISFSDHDHSFQLNIHTDTGQDLLLFTDEDKTAILEAGHFLAQQTGIPFSTKIKNA